MRKLFLLLACGLLSAETYAAKARTVYLSETDMAVIHITPGRSTVLSFPIKPNKVIVGNQGIFAVEYVENDLAIAVIRAPARSNLFVYMEGRRFAFDLTTVGGGGDEIILVRDAIEKMIETKLRGKREK